jgi:hypothetical protein
LLFLCNHIRFTKNTGRNQTPTRLWGDDGHLGGIWKMTWTFTPVNHNFPTYPTQYPPTYGTNFWGTGQGNYGFANTPTFPGSTFPGWTPPAPPPPGPGLQVFSGSGFDQILALGPGQLPSNGLQPNIGEVLKGAALSTTSPFSLAGVLDYVSSALKSGQPNNIINALKYIIADGRSQPTQFGAGGYVDNVLNGVFPTFT